MPRFPGVLCSTEALDIVEAGLKRSCQSAKRFVVSDGMRAALLQVVSAKRGDKDMV